MTLTIYEYDFFYWRAVRKAQIEFRLGLADFFLSIYLYFCFFSITRELNGHLEVLQNGGISQSIVSSVKTTAINVKFHDPAHFLQDAVLHYFWFINTVNYGQTQTVREIKI